MDGQGNLEQTWKLREKSGNLKIHVNGYGRQSSENLFTLFKRGKDYVLRDSLSPSSSSLGGHSQRKEFAPLGSKFFPLRIPQI